jgi:RNA polymerase sigma factor (sigma-70 family)
MKPSFEAAFAAEFRPLHRYLRRRVGSPVAEDVAQATFATAYANWDGLDADRPIRPWLYGIASNLLRHHWRSERRMLRAYARSATDAIVGHQEGARGRAEGDASYGELATALAELRPQDLEILLLHAWAELSDEEIAQALHLPVGTVKSRLHRTRGRLQKQLGPNGQLQPRAALIATPEEER